ncbi:DUF5655 domain-containing protein [Mucilaginibacter ginsenosidivorans]|uniref:DUF5655 domain-containing protein n=1 Tax=Mucilaginibacter ginsenosidivorans TaxID=398053 RepID=A0A5B8UY25_9SPHI|nr:DUF5655 domain-containing protein [Mucilaginibacter ginsenosidivorans]QEC64097.1 hypothetical protein FRZ54_16440 [Mucilaginibacter ginsenosidivorans]
MRNYTGTDAEEIELRRFLIGKSVETLALFDHLINEFQKIGPVTVHPAKTMIGLANSHKRVVYITQLGKNFIHVVFPFKERFEDNLCFQKIAQVPGDVQCNHHFRMLHTDDVNDEVRKFMKIAYDS